MFAEETRELKSGLCLNKSNPDNLKVKFACSVEKDCWKKFLVSKVGTAA